MSVAKQEILNKKEKVHNFNAGPSVLPKVVFEQASRAVLNYNDSGLSILEMGHRTKEFQPIMDEAINLVKELMQLDADTGVWSSKALKEAKLFGNVDVVCSSKESNYNFIPKDFAVPNDATYFHITTNNTIYGTQWKTIPDVSMPLVADMCSDIFSRQRDFNSFGLIYAGAQKNMGPAGINLVVVNKNILGKVKRPIPTIMDYRNHIKEGSMLNTPPVFAVYVSMLTLKWLKDSGGISAIEKINNQKAQLMYETIDKSALFKSTASNEDRSTMNACFVMNEPALEKQFLEFAEKHNIYGIKGHRSVGGFRASMYNALPLSSVQYLTDVMIEFEKNNL